MPIAQTAPCAAAQPASETLRQCWTKWRIRRLGAELLRSEPLVIAKGHEACPDQGAMERMQLAMQQLSNIRKAALFVGCIFAAHGREGMKTTGVGRRLLACFFLNRFPETHSSNERLSAVCTALTAAVSAVIAAPSVDSQIAFVHAWLSFDTAFGAWQQQDREDLVQSISAERQSLEDMRSAIPPESRPEWEPHIAEYDACLDAAMRRLSTGEHVNSDGKLNSKVAGNAKAHQAIIPIRPQSPVAQPNDEARTRMQMMHDLVIDPKYSFSSLAQRKPLPATFNNMNQSDAAQLILCVKDHVLAMLDARRHPTIISDINTALDADQITREASHGVLDVRASLKFIASMLSQMCAPVRDEAAAALVRDVETAPIDTLVQRFNDLLFSMHEDHANYLLKKIKPAAHGEIVDAERAWCASHVYIRAAHAQAMVAKVCATMAQVHGRETAAAMSDLVPRVISECIAQTACTDAKNELLESFDDSRLRTIRTAIDSVARLSALMVLTRGAKCPIDGTSEKAMRLRAIVGQGADADAIAAELPAVAPAAVSSVLSGTNPVLIVMARRLRELLATAMRPDGGRLRDVKALEKHGVPAVCGNEWRSACDTAQRVHVLHTQVHGPTYKQWIKDALAAIAHSEQSEAIAQESAI